ncbi:tRNA (adenosine(37)-N6)-threonylcarbamoyltransferase complex ATPase subunit type 1 TsaE [Aliikangiella sp. G2MR2-5]|uniref:tRNA (adenosine(37)-N6)-threonylcarbamoyltransferase complex ATPase subunit type 1 TsaE n=1 Tax=Aliikangiella sp. G2MR2-5 TaxID=2788943 RepID=UPI0018AB6971|nr:tRNA (adenosine(37)-N6)-threonylcarbamoyltransferase complex ATPase subunit type 1 TsaE [Aliikangiella sp. G2MR2-5]
MSVHLPDEAATLNIGTILSENLPPKALIFLNGNLGAGKTTLVRGILRASGHQGSTKSPTYTLVEPYEVEDRKFYHFDLYRLADPEELEYIGIRDYLDESAICLVEWPDKGEGLLPEPDLTINLDYEGEARNITLVAGDCLWAKALLKLLQAEHG